MEKIARLCRPDGTETITEVYPALWNFTYPAEDRTPDQHDAYSVAAALQQAALDNRLPAMLTPSLAPAEQTVARVEGWILGT